jgi:hypothetical protein
MQDKPEGSKEQSQTEPSPPPPPAPIPPADITPIPPIAGQGAAPPSRDEQPRNPNPPPEDKFTKNDKVMMWLTGVIAFGTLVSAVAIGLQWREMVGGGKQTEQIIAAANINAEAATKSAQAAKDFADSAVKINAGVGDAAGKLNTQAGATQKLAQAARHSADATSQLLETEKSLDRASISAQNPEVSDGHDWSMHLKIGLINSGRTTASKVRYYFASRGEPIQRMNDREAFSKNIRDVISTFPRPQNQAGWIDLPDILPNNGSFQLDFVFRRSTMPLDIDGYTFWVGRVTYVTIFGESRWKDFCIYVRIDYTKDRVPSYTPGYCPAGQEGDELDLNKVDNGSQNPKAN